MPGPRTSPNGQSGTSTGQATNHPAPPAVSPSGLHAHELSQIRAAEEQARKVYSGPVGELIARELHHYAECGHRFERAGLLPRVVRQVLGLSTATDTDGAPPLSQRRPRPTWPATHNR